MQGLSDETVQYVLAHPSNAFDRLALELFASGLAKDGYRDRAAAIYGSLLLEGEDQEQQAEALRRCIRRAAQMSRTCTCMLCKPRSQPQPAPPARA